MHLMFVCVCVCVCVCVYVCVTALLSYSSNATSFWETLFFYETGQQQHSSLTQLPILFSTLCQPRDRLLTEESATSSGGNLQNRFWMLPEGRSLEPMSCSSVHTLMCLPGQIPCRRNIFIQGVSWGQFLGIHVTHWQTYAHDMSNLRNTFGDLGSQQIGTLGAHLELGGKGCHPSDGSTVWQVYSGFYSTLSLISSQHQLGVLLARWKQEKEAHSLPSEELGK